jgi:inorganic pyrophosphatase
MNTAITSTPLWELMKVHFKPHPWHGIPIGEKAPNEVYCYIEIVPTDTIKYEIDKVSGFLKVDRPQELSSLCPTPYGFIPRTFCAESVGRFSAERTGRAELEGDGDPLDVCVLTERTISHGDVLLQAIPIGGLRMIDGNEADDKIVAVLRGDSAYGNLKDISEAPPALVRRIVHYFVSYKQAPGATKASCEVTRVYGRDEAHQVIECSRDDYDVRFGNLESLLEEAR